MFRLSACNYGSYFAEPPLQWQKRSQKGYTDTSHHPRSPPLPTSLFNVFCLFDECPEIESFSPTDLARPNCWCTCSNSQVTRNDWNETPYSCRSFYVVFGLTYFERWTKGVILKVVHRVLGWLYIRVRNKSEDATSSNTSLISLSVCILVCIHKLLVNFPD